MIRNLNSLFTIYYSKCLLSLHTSCLARYLVRNTLNDPLNVRTHTETVPMVKRGHDLTASIASPVSNGKPAYTCLVVPVTETFETPAPDARRRCRRRRRRLPRNGVDTPPDHAHRSKHRWPSSTEYTGSDIIPRRSLGRGNRSSNCRPGRCRSGRGGGGVLLWSRLLCWLACLRVGYSINPGKP